MAANIGGMGTIIGTPSNAIAAGLLGAQAPTFVGWMGLALPPALMLVVAIRYVLLKRFPSNEAEINIEALRGVDHADDSTKKHSSVPTVPSWKKSVVVATFAVTVLLWLTESLHPIPTAVVTVALSASLAMCLPVSTPPNAIIYASGALQSRDFWLMGLVAGLLGPLVVLGWVYFASTLF